MTEVNVVSYNILSSSLSSPSYYDKSDPSYLDPKKRLPRIFKKLEQCIETKSIICLQEVSMDWAGQFHKFFLENNYYFISTLYGSKFSGYMGVGIAFPLSKYKLLDCNIKTVSDTKPWPKEKKTLRTRFYNSLRYIKKLITRENSISDPWEHSKKIKNRAIILKLYDLDSNCVFSVATYHMPCVFWNPKVMMIHSSLYLEAVEKSITDDKFYIVTGDFNIKPDSHAYEMLTSEYSQPPDELYDDRPHDPWRINHTILRSAYNEVNKREPISTNHCKIRTMDFSFAATLDYIFVSPGCNVKKVRNLELCGLCPNEQEPSDHILIGATITSEQEF